MGARCRHGDIETVSARPEAMAAGLFIDIPYSIRRTERGKRGAMFTRRGEVEKFLAVAEAGKIVAAADRLAIGQPALTRAIARLESRFGAPLFERISTGVRPTALGVVAAEQARRLLRAFEEADDRIGGALAGRSGRIRATADGLWMAGIVPEAVGRFREIYPGIELRLRCAGRAEGLRLLDAGDCDLHCGGVDDRRHLPDHVRRETLPPVTMGVVANLHHPLQGGVADPEALADWPWVDCIADALPSGGPQPDPASPDDFLGRLHARTGRRAASVLRAGAAGLALMASGPYLAWLPLELLVRLPGRPLSPLPLKFGRRRSPTGLVLRRSAESLAPVRALREILLETAGRNRG